MKKIAIFFLVIIIVVSGISYLYLNYKANYENAKRENMQFESYYNQEVYGTQLATIINRAIDNNMKNEVEKDKKGKYINNDTNSININIKFTDDDNVYNMEKIYNNEIVNFVNYYGKIKFKCSNIEYHSSTNKVKYMLFEQSTE